MRIKIAVAVLLLTFTVVAQTNPSSAKPAPPVSEKAEAHSKPEPSLYKLFGNYGGWWNNISESEKDAFIDGFTTAMARANSLTVALCQSKMKEAQPGSANFNERLYGGMDLCLVGEEFAFNVDKPLRPKLDEFYKEPLNARIPAQYAMSYVRDEIAGKKTAGQILDELNGWRSILNGEHEKN